MVAKEGSLKIMDLLLRSGAKINSRYSESPISDLKETPLDCAVGGGKLDAVRFLLSRGGQLGNDWCLLEDSACAKLLLDAGPSVSSVAAQRALRTSTLALVRMVMRAYPEYVEKFLEVPGRMIYGRPVPAEIQNIAKEYFERCNYYLSERHFLVEDNPDLMFAVAAYFLDWQILRVFKDQWLEQMKSWRDPDGKNLLMGAIEMFDTDALRWFLDEKICSLVDVDSEGHDILFHAISTDDPFLINEIVSSAGLIVSSETVQKVLQGKKLALLRMIIKTHPECIGYVLEVPERAFSCGPVGTASEEVLRSAKEYFINREFYLDQGRFQEGDNPDAVFAIAAYFLDWPVLRIFRDRWLEQLRTWRDADGKNLLMGALEMLDRDALHWLSQERICDSTDVDSEGNDALCLAIRMRDMFWVNEVLYASKVSGDHLRYAALFKNPEIVARLALLYRYSEWPSEHKPAGLNLFR